MVNFKLIFLGMGITLMSIFLRFYIFTADFLGHFGYSATDIYNISETMRIIDPLYYITTVGFGLFVVVWGITH